MKLKLILLSVLFQIGVCNAALIYVHLSQEDQQVVYDSVWTFLQHDPVFSNNLHREDFSITAYREYFVEPRDVAAGRLLSAVKPGGWRFFFSCGTNAIGGTVCKSDPKSGKPLACVEFGTNDYPLETINITEQLLQIKEQDYEVRLFSAGFFHGLWLHTKLNDFFIPADTGFGKLQAFRPYSEPQLVKVLQPYERTMMPINMESGRQFERNLSMYQEAMINYEEVHYGKRGPISPVFLEIQEDLSAVAQILNLQGTSSEGQKLSYKVKVTFSDRTHLVVSRVDVLERILPIN
jgi:hypothetical protein